MSALKEATSPRPPYEVLSLAEGYSFYDQNKEALGSLFNVIGIDPPRNLDEAVAATQPWVKGDHFSPTKTAAIPNGRAEEVRGIYESMGLVSEQPLPAGTYDQIIVLGALQRANNTRLKFLDEALKDDVELAADG
ncbi:MAG: hypothetical protein LC687_08375 [Actinobacteria bacterium]|nr:hypothetical protein [Actinomycetota bacterium]